MPFSTPLPLLSNFCAVISVDLVDDAENRTKFLCTVSGVLVLASERAKNRERERERE